eukprot:c711_g1_i1.p2 GENE.c711_g1_i1~~c711_g1_i1.p2  ORF type:complete len:105 (+),score=17.11 c711_g1_i1:22-315(+)
MSVPPEQKPKFDKYLFDAERDFEEFHNTKSRALRPFKENPLVPIGALVTAGILVGGLASFAKGAAGRSQLFMRARVVAQGATVLAVAGSIFFIKNKQ